MRTWRRYVALIAFASGVTAIPAAIAQTYPSKPVHLIEGGGVGTPSDIMARGVAQALSQALGQPMVVDNRPGVNGIISTEACSKATPDGHTLCFLSNSYMSMNPFLYTRLPYDPQRDFIAVVNVGFVGGIIVAKPSLPANSIRELVEMAKAKPDVFNWATWGNGSFSHLTLSTLQASTGTTFHHVPYKSANLALTAVVSGEADVAQNNPLVVLPMVKAGKLKPLAVVGPRRFAILPAVPTFAEAGFDLDFLRGCYGMYAPAGTPKSVVQQLNVAVNKLLADQKFVDQFVTSLGVEPAGGSPEEFAGFLKKDRETAAKVVKAANLQAQ